MSAYRELVYRAAVAWGNADPDAITSMKRALAEVYRTLENVTPEMEAAGNSVNIMRGDVPRRMLLAMLRVSPLAAPAEKEAEG